MIINAGEAQIRALQRYGYYLGMAFQVTDDILDYVASEEVLGKPVGSDIRQGVITLPAIYAMKFDAQGDRLRNLLSTPVSCTNQAEEIIKIVTESDGIDYAYQVSCKYLELARRQLRFLPDVPVRKNLDDIAQFISAREF
jgi:heptaprenyl diphosphate synthase